MVDDKYSSDNLIDFKYTRVTASNYLATRVKFIKEDLSKGGIFEESTVSVLARALAVSTGSGVIVTSRFTKE